MVATPDQCEVGCQICSNLCPVEAFLFVDEGDFPRAKSQRLINERKGLPTVKKELNMMQSLCPTTMTDLQNRITITVKSFATLREVMDTKIPMDLPRGSTIRSLLNELIRRYPGLDELIFSAPDTLKDFVNILKNGRNVEFLGRLDTPLDDGDLIALFPPAAGG